MRIPCLAFPFVLQSLFLHGLAFGVSGEISDLKGSVSIRLEAGSIDRPHFLVGSSTLKGEAVFRGQVKSIVDNNISFYQVPSLLDPDEMQPPLKAGLLASVKARASVALDGNGSIDQVTLEFPGNNYSQEPKVFVELPTAGSSSDVDFRMAVIEASVDPSTQEISSLQITDGGAGYTFPPKISIEGGCHFISLVESASSHKGKFFKIVSNDGDSLIVDNPLSLDLTEIVKPDQIVEIYEAWTLGSLFGHRSDEVLLAEGNSTGDQVYVLKPKDQQIGSNDDFMQYYYDGDFWRSYEDPDRNDSGDTVIFYPDQAFIIARRNEPALDLVFSGGAATSRTFANFPGFLERQLLSNPYGVDVMLSDLIAATNITMDENVTDKWLAHQSQEIADNVKILNGNIWNTYWHDGTNLSVAEVARATARRGTGIAGGITQLDVSMSQGVISSMTNPSEENIIVTSVNHKLKNGFTVFIENAQGYKTNAQKQQVDENGNLVSEGAIPSVIQSSANGYFEIRVVDRDHFELLGKTGNCDFIDDGKAVWQTGSGGMGYSSNAFVSFIGGGGRGASGIAYVQDGQVSSILITESGAGYVRPPKVFIHAGGWKKQGAGSSPFNDVLIPAGSGILLIRNHDQGVRSLFGISSPFRGDG